MDTRTYHVIAVGGGPGAAPGMQYLAQRRLRVEIVGKGAG